MAAELRAGLPIIRSNTGEVCVKYSRFEEAKASVMYAGTHSRGGSNSLVWVSEWGTIQATDIARSEENSDGSSPFGRRRNLCNRKHLARRTPRASVGVGQAGPGDTGRTEGTVGLATRLFSIGPRILAIATRYRGHLALRPGDISRASRG